MCMPSPPICVVSDGGLRLVDDDEGKVVERDDTDASNNTFIAYG